MIAWKERHWFAPMAVCYLAQHAPQSMRVGLFILHGGSPENELFRFVERYVAPLSFCRMKGLRLRRLLLERDC